jgi:hypothetical protein
VGRERAKNGFLSWTLTMICQLVPNLRCYKCATVEGDERCIENSFTVLSRGVGDILLISLRLGSCVGRQVPPFRIQTVLISYSAVRVLS